MIKKEHIVVQSGVIPFIIKNRKLKLMLITSTSGKKWIFPKGIVEKEMTMEESAAIEAYEEAGITGDVLSVKIGTYELEKYGSKCKVTMFPLEVEKILTKWPEDKLRERKWVLPDDVKNYIKDRQILKLVKKFNSLKLYNNNQ